MIMAGITIFFAAGLASILRISHHALCTAPLLPLYHCIHQCIHHDLHVHLSISHVIRDPKRFQYPLFPTTPRPPSQLYSFILTCSR
jgi:hypothetical protein